MRKSVMNGVLILKRFVALFLNVSITWAKNE